MCNADAISSGVSSGEAISSKQKRPTLSRHDSESVPPAALRRHRHAAHVEAGPPAARARDADSGPANSGLPRGGRAASPDEVSGGAGGGAGGGAVAADDRGATGGAPGGSAGEAVAATGAQRRRGRGEASDLAVVFSPAAAATGVESDADEDVRAHAARERVRVI